MNSILVVAVLLFVGSYANSVSKPEIKELKCGWQDWVECAAKVAECAATCDGDACAGVSFYECPACLTCFGSSAEKCIQCLVKSKIGPITPAVTTKALQVVTQPKCAWQDWIECAAKVAECAATCDGDACAGQDFYSCPACLTCFGGSAEQCIKCLSSFKLTLMRSETKAIAQKKPTSAVQLKTQPKCGWQDWVECAAKVAECAATCDGDACAGVSFYECPACLTCFGSSAEKCIQCLAATKRGIMSQL